MDPHNVTERVWKAVSSLAVGEKRLQDRLEFAAIDLHALKPEEFEDDRARELFEQIMAAFESEDGANGEGSFAASTRGMRNESARDLAQLIVELDAIYRPLS